MHVFLHSLHWEKSFYVNFSHKTLNLKKSLIKAIGKFTGKTLRVIDVGCGFGSDAFCFGSLGCLVTMLECNVWVYMLVKDGLDRGIKDNRIKHIIHNMQVVNINAKDYLEHLSNNELPDVIYLDPMFTAHGSAKVQKYAQALRLISKADHECNEQLLTIALQKAQKVIVKRNRHELPLNNSIPHHSIHSDTIRFDVYYPRKSK